MKARVLLVLALLVLALLAGAVPVAALDPGLPLSRLTRSQWRSEEGLPQDSVNAVLQTRDGFLWIGTRGGLARFDGVYFAVFDRLNTPALRNHAIQALAEDPQDGTLWIATEGGDLLSYRGGAFRRFGRDDGLLTSRITSLAFGQPGELWIGTYGQGLIRFAGGHFAPVSGVPHTIISRIFKASDGGLWVSSYGGGVYHIRGGRLETIGKERGLPDLRTWAAENMAGDRVAIATDRGLCLYEGGRCRNLGREEGLSHRQITALHADRHGILWIGTYGGGINRLFPDGRIEYYRRDQAGADDIVWTIFEDRAGMIWIGTINNGLRLLADGPFSTLTEEDGLSSRRVTVLEIDPAERLWVGTRDAGLSCFEDGLMQHFGRAQGLDADTVWSLAADGERLYIGTDNGLFLHQGGRIEPVPLVGFSNAPAISSLLLTNDALYVGSSRGLLRKGNLGSPRLYTVDDGLPSNSVRDLLRDHRGRIWIATLGGIAVLESDEIRAITEREGLPSGNVVAIHEDAKNEVIYLALAAGGLAALHENGRIESWTTREGLREDDLTAIAQDDLGHLWLGSGRGILRVATAALEARLRDPQNPLPQAFFDRLDGVGEGGVWASGHSVVKAKSGLLYFATLGGLTIYDPQRLRMPQTPRAQITRFQVDGRDQGPRQGGEELDSESEEGQRKTRAVVPAGAREVRFELAAPLPHAGAKVALRYQLKGVDPGWVDAGRQRVLVYSGLAPGNYELLVESSNIQGQFSNQPSTLRLEVQPGFQQSWKFTALVLLVPVLLGFLIYRIRVFQHQRRKQELARRIAEASAAIEVLSGLLPICSSCHKVRDDGGFWEQVETYLSSHSEAQFTHGLCPGCCAKVLSELDDSKHGLKAS